MHAYKNDTQVYYSVQKSWIVEIYYQTELAVQKDCSGDGFENISERFRDLNVLSLFGVVLVKKVEVLGHCVPVISLDLDKTVDHCLQT